MAKWFRVMKRIRKAYGVEISPSDLRKVWFNEGDIVGLEEKYLKYNLKYREWYDQYDYQNYFVWFTPRKGEFKGCGVNLLWAISQALNKSGP